MTLLNSAVGEAIASKPRATPTAALRVGNTNRGKNSSFSKERNVTKWLKSKRKPGGQHKVPRLSNERIMIEEILRLKNGAGSGMQKAQS